MRHEVHTGLDILVEEGFKNLKNHKIAILANQASVDKNFDHIINLAKKFNLNIKKIFAPEHGLFGTQQDMEFVGDSYNNNLNIPIISLYGDHKKSLSLCAQELANIDILVCDLQDIGARYYTFHCTIAWAMAACEQAQTKLIILDRPNPIGASRIEGNLVSKPCFSFVGAYPIPNRHGCTMGELVLFIKNYFSRNFDLEIIKLKNYKRDYYLDQTQLNFISPSPNMPNINTALVYPGMCLIEGTNLSEGRGTCMPFELVGAPYITDNNKFKNLILEHDNPGIKLRPIKFKPMFQKHAQKICKGVFIHILDREKFQPVKLGLSIIKAAMNFSGFDWRQEAYEYETERLAIDLLLGDTNIRRDLETENNLVKILGEYKTQENIFSKTIQEFLLY